MGRDGPLIPMKMSGHCAYGPDHSKCRKVDCTCACHIIPDFLAGVRDQIAEGDRATRRTTHRKRRKLL